MIRYDSRWHDTICYDMTCPSPPPPPPPPFLLFPNIKLSILRTPYSVGNSACDTSWQKRRDGALPREREIVAGVGVGVGMGVGVGAASYVEVSVPPPPPPPPGTQFMRLQNSKNGKRSLFGRKEGGRGGIPERIVPRHTSERASERETGVDMRGSMNHPSVVPRYLLYDPTQSSLRPHTPHPIPHTPYPIPIARIKNSRLFQPFLSPKMLLLEIPKPREADRREAERELKPDVASKPGQTDLPADWPDEPHLRHAHDGAHDAEAEGQHRCDARGQQGGGVPDGDVIFAGFEDEVLGEGDAFVDG